jgi:hypothetical protein
MMLFADNNESQKDVFPCCKVHSIEPGSRQLKRASSN